MITLHLNPLSVHVAPFAATPAYEVCRFDNSPDPLDPADLSPEDLRWWAEVSADEEAGRRAQDPDTSDAAWLYDQGLYHALRADRETFDVEGMVSCVLQRTLSALRWHRRDTASAYALAVRVDLASVRVPAGSRRSPLAEALDVEASWYLNLDTAAGRLVAFELVSLADQADELGSASACDFVVDEAAYRMAAMDAMAEAV